MQAEQLTLLPGHVASPGPNGGGADELPVVGDTPWGRHYWTKSLTAISVTVVFHVVTFLRPRNVG